MTARRRLLLLGGDQAWGERWVLGQLAAADTGGLLWVAGQAPQGIAAIPARRVTQGLGGECRLLVFDAHQGFHPDAFAAAVGMLRGGGDCVLLAPPPETWAAFADPDQRRIAAYPRDAADMHGNFLARLARRWATDTAVRRITPDDAAGTQLCIAPAAGKGVALNPAQQAAVAAVQRVAHGHARRPLVITADRGRGKSTLLGVAAAQLLAEGLPLITVVAAHRAAAETLFAHARAAVGLPPHGVADVAIGAGRLCFRTPAECLADRASAPGLVLVDEAAAIPVAVLADLLERSNRLVFASTVHGYEGSGRGFELRFKAVLDSRMPQWRVLHLDVPVRWPAGDPLEALLNDAFLLDADLEPVAIDGAPQIVAVDAAALATDEPLLRAVFGLLVNAHYQTRPSDLRQLLDDPDSRIWLARQGGAVVGVLLASVEGGFDAAMAAEVIDGRRRPRGHLLPQSLAVHAGLDECLTQRVLRVQRIAVHPQRQRQGIGTDLLQALGAHAAIQGFDLLGCAFGIEAGLLRFWQRAAFVPVRLGIRVDPASGAHSLFMLHALSAAGRALARRAERRFRSALPWSLGSSLDALDPVLAVPLLRGRDCTDLALDESDRVQLARIATGVRQVASADDLVWKALVHIAANAQVAPARIAPLLARVLQHQPLEHVCKRHAIAGRDALDEQLRGLLTEQTKTFLSSG